MLSHGYVELAQEAEQELNFRGFYYVPSYVNPADGTFEKKEKNEKAN